MPTYLTNKRKVGLGQNYQTLRQPLHHSRKYWMAATQQADKAGVGSCRFNPIAVVCAVKLGHEDSCDHDRDTCEHAVIESDIPYVMSVLKSR